MCAKSGFLLVAALAGLSGVVSQDLNITNTVVASDLTALWIDQLGADGLVLTERAEGVGFVPVGSAVYSYQTSSSDEVGAPLLYWINLIFSQPIVAEMTLEDVQESFLRASVNQVPTPGLELEEFWQITPLTLFSSFSDGVDITSFDNGSVVVEINTSFFAVRGQRRLSAPPLFGAPMSQDDFFQVRRDFDLHLTLVAILV